MLHLNTSTVYYWYNGPTDMRKGFEATTHLQSNHKGRNPFPETLRREEQIINPEGADLVTLKKNR